MLSLLSSAALGIDISTGIANWQGIPFLNNPYPGYLGSHTPSPGTRMLGQGPSPAFPSPGGCPTYTDLETFTTNPAIPGCPAGCVVWEATLTVNIPTGGGDCALIQGGAASDDTVAIKVVNSRFPGGQYILGSDTSGIGVWNSYSPIPVAGQTDASGRGYFADGVNTLTLRIDNRVTCLMLMGYIDAQIALGSCPSPPPPPPAPVAVVVFDPHLTFHHGGRADFKGEDNTWYNLLSAKGVSLNVLFTHADFRLTKPQKRLVHGSRMQQLAMTVRTDSGRMLAVEFNATASAVHRARLIEGAHTSKPKEIGWVVATTDATAGNGLASMAYHRSKTIENLKISMARKQAAGMSSIRLVIDTGKWAVTAWSMPFPNPKAHPGKALLNLKVEASKGYDPEKDVVAPHGIIGQSYDGDNEGVSGAVDDYKGDEFTTAAMAEGAIEGKASEYKMANKFGYEFKYSRFDKEAAKPRDTSKLAGKRVTGGKAGAGANHADIAPDEVEEA